MEQPVALQLRELALALALGAALAGVYALLGLLRRGRRLTAAADALFCLLTLCALLAFALYVGRGRLRPFVPAACLSSGAALSFFMKKLRIFVKKLLHLPKNLLQ